MSQTECSRGNDTHLVSAKKMWMSSCVAEGAPVTTECSWMKQLFAACHETAMSYVA